MKRLIVPVLLMCLILPGCAAQPDITPIPSDTLPVPVTEPAGIYEPDAKIAQLTEGAIRAYPLGGKAAGIAPMGDGILVFSGTDSTTLTLFTGPALVPAATVTLDCSIDPSGCAVRIGEQGVTYYDATQNQLAALDDRLAEVSRTALPDDLQGIPAIGKDLQTIYYCTTDSLRALDLQTMRDRLVKEMHFPDQTAAALHCDDTVIACLTGGKSGEKTQLFINAQTGIGLYEAPEDFQLHTQGSTYFARLMDGIYPELLFGDSEQGPTLLTSHTYNVDSFPLLQIGGAVLQSRSTTDRQTRLDYYDLHSGRHTAGISLSGTQPVVSIFAADETTLWFTRYDPDYGCDVLFQWDMEKSPVTDDRNWFSPRYSARQPDMEGLVDCRDIADTLSRKYGVQILLWTDATAFQPWDYTLIPEFQVSVILENLKELELFLSMYPPGFLEKAAELTGSGRIQICLVRSILGKESVSGTLPEAVGLQYWDHNANSYLCLAVQPENLARNAAHEMSHIIDSRVLTLCKAYDNWNDLNPDGFRYNHGRAADLPEDARKWTVGPDRAFLDLYSMTYPKEDRARIMEYAVKEGYEACFESETMQKKLRTLCVGIRQAFDLEKSPEVFRWEQFLKTPLAPRP